MSWYHDEVVSIYPDRREEDRCYDCDNRASQTPSGLCTWDHGVDDVDICSCCMEKRLEVFNQPKEEEA